MGQITHRDAVPASAWMVVGAETASCAILAAPATVRYADGTTDTLAAGTPALAAGVANFDRTRGPWLAYTVKGSGALSLIREPLAATITQDYAVLARILHTRVEVWQPRIAVQGNSFRGGAVLGALPSQSFSGGALVGTLSGQSFSGGAVLAGIGYVMSWTQGGADSQTDFEFFIKVPAAPATNTTLVDYNGGAMGYVRVFLTPTLHIMLEYAILGNHAQVDLSTVAISPGTWYYVSVGNRGSLPINNFFVTPCGRVDGPGGVTLAGEQYGPTFNAFGSGYHSYGMTCQLGVGVSTSSGYANFPNSAGWEISKFFQVQVNNNGFPLLTMNLGDRTGGEVNYTCRQTLGASATLIDASGNNRNAGAGGSGLTINLDGPFA